jgi:GH24 family phage-related lysozyme (muramidase)
VGIKASSMYLGKLKEMEGLVLSPQRDGKTSKTAVGYGDNDGPQVPVTEAQAFDRLLKRVKLAEDETAPYLKRNNLTQAQQDVVVDMHYNLGLSGMKGIFAAINSGDDSAVASQMLQYNKSKNADTGQMEVLDALTKRTQWRSNQWTSGGTQPSPQIESKVPFETAPVQGGNAPAFDEYFDAEVDNIAETILPSQAPVQEPIAVDDFFDAETDSIAEQIGASSQVPSGSPTALTPDSKTLLDISGDATHKDPAANYLLKRSESERLSKKLGVPLMAARGMLLDSSIDEVLARQAHAITAEQFPSVSKWATSDVDNYVLMRSTGDFARKVELKARPLNTDNNYVKALKGSGVALQRYAIHAQMLTSTIDSNEAKGMLRELDLQQQDLAFKDPKNIRAKRAELNNMAVKGYNMITEGKVLEGGVEGLTNSYKSLLLLAGNPDMYAEQVIGSVSSFVPTILISGGAMAGASGAGALVAAPAISAGVSLSMLMSFGERMDKKLQKFRDPTTGAVNYDLAFSDPKVVADMRADAGIYAGMMTAAELVLGKFAKGIASKVKGKVASKVAGVAGATVIEEGGGQFAASTAGDLYSGEVKENFGENIVDSIDEAVTSPGMAILGGSAPFILQNGIKAKANIAAHRIKKQAEARDKANTLKGIRQELSQEESSKTHNTQVQGLIDESVSPQAPSTPIDPEGLPPIPVVDGDNEASPSDLKTYVEQSKSKDITFYPKDFEAFVESKGLDPNVILQGFSKEVRERFANGKNLDSSVQISIAEWITALDNDVLDGIDDIAVFPDVEISKQEADEMTKDIEKKVSEIFKMDTLDIPPIPVEDGDLPPPVPGIPMEFIEAEGPDGNLVMRPITLLDKARGRVERNVKAKILRGLKFATSKAKGVQTEALEAAAEVEFNHMLFRSRALGIPLDELATLKFGILSDAEAKKDGFITEGQHEHIITESHEALAGTKILFSKYANPSTVVHELGHSWLHDMSRDAVFIYNLDVDSMTEHQLEYKEAMDSAAKLFGLKRVDDIITMDKAKRTAIHESFAQTSEMYFLKGVFANSTVKKVMEAFRQYLLPIAQFVGRAYVNYPALQINPEVERMFEIITGASEAIERVLGPMFDELGADKDMLGADWPKYAQARAEARSNAIGTLYTDQVLKGERKRRKEGLEVQKEVIAEKEKEIDELPAFALSNSLKESYAAYVKGGKKGTDPRFSFESVVKTLFEGKVEFAERLKAMLPVHIMAGKKHGGYDIAEFMSDNGIHDVKQMIDALTDIPNRDAYLNEMVKAEMDTILPMLDSDEDIHNAAVEAINNAGKEKVLALEFKILAEQHLSALKGIASKLINPADLSGQKAQKRYEKRGGDMVLQAPAKKFAAWKYIQDSNTHGRKAAAAWKSNDIDAALMAKEKQIINFQAYKAAIRAQKEMARTPTILKKIKALNGNIEAAAQVDLEVVAQTNRVSEQAINGVVSGLELQDFSPESGITLDQVRSINTQINLYNEKSRNLPAQFNNVEARIQLNELLDGMLGIARKARSIEVGGIKTTVKEVSEAFSDELNQNTNIVKLSDYTKDVLGIKWLMEGLLKKGTYTNSVAFGLISKVTDMEAFSSIEKKKYKKTLTEALKPLTKKDKLLESILFPIEVRGRGILSSITRQDFSKKSPVAMPGIGFTANSEYDVLMAALHMGSESGSEQFLNRNTATAVEYNDDGTVDRTKWDADFQKLIDSGIITEDHLKFLNVVHEIFAELQPLASKAMRRVDGYNIGNVKGSPSTFMVNGKPFKLNGGYAPISVNEDLRSPTTQAGLMSLDTHGMPALGLWGQKKGFTKSRTGSEAPINLDLTTLSSYINASVDVAYLREPLSDFRKIFLNPEVKAAINARAEGAYSGIINPWFERTSSQIFTEYKKGVMNDAARSARKGANSIMYFLSVPSGLRQTLGLLQSSGKVDAKRLAKAAAEITISPFKTNAEISGMSNVMKERQNTSIREQHKSYETLETNYDYLSKTGDMANTIGSIIAQTFQQFVDNVTWKAAFNAAIDEGKDEKHAALIADDIVVRSQGSLAVSAMSNIQSGDDKTKFLLMAKSVPLINLNEIIAPFISDAPKSEKAQTIARVIAVNIVMPILLEEMVRAMYKAGTSDEEEEEKERNLGKDLALKAALSIGSTVSPVKLGLVEGAVGYGNPSFGAGFSTVTRTLKNSKEGLKHLRDSVPLNKKESRALADLITLTTGYPIGSAAGFMSDAYFWQKDKAELEDELDIRKSELQRVREEQE